ncbi:uncharacterized protein LOC121388147 [Gigantopelta aegis]|uniref:uncharacterized protein LOC121388147 n=1 Tax=Gigantopelta aegis TaxID=1735272 RepID=UPI001B88DD30|nr:uncharacterized protein LOC121388147 [Gigantopelta aegis]
MDVSLHTILISLLIGLSVSVNLNPLDKLQQADDQNSQKEIYYKYKSQYDHKVALQQQLQLQLQNQQKVKVQQHQQLQKVYQQQQQQQQQQEQQQQDGSSQHKRHQEQLELVKQQGTQNSPRQFYDGRGQRVNHGLDGSDNSYWTTVAAPVRNQESVFSDGDGRQRHHGIPQRIPVDSNKQEQAVHHGGKGSILYVKSLQNAGYNGMDKNAGDESVDRPNVGVRQFDSQQNGLPTMRRGDIPGDQDSHVLPAVAVGGGYNANNQDFSDRDNTPESNIHRFPADKPASYDRPGVIRTVNDPVDANQNQNNGDQQQDNYPNFNNFPQHPQRELGGFKLSWDWSDFSVTFDDYGAAELKVRRAPHATTGEPWPMPQYYIKKKKKVSKIDKDAFHFKIIAETCDIIEEGIRRYRKTILEDAVEDMYDNLQNAEGTTIDNPASKYEQDVYRKAPVITSVDVKIHKPCSKYPSVESDESYDIKVKKGRASIMANEVWGALRGLETFSQLVWKGLDGEDPDDRGKNANLYVRECVISDYPRFPHRGILIDSSRHFIFKEVIFDVLDAMEQNKMNVMHWHIVDDQSFPYQSEVFPELSKKGAFHPSFVYTQEDLREIIDYARFRGIRVMPEFDTPGHTYSWGLSRPELLTQCYQGSQIVKGYLGPIDPTKNSTYRFLKTLFSEVLNVFKDQYIHLGGDEVPLSCWSSNPDVVNFGLNLQKKESGLGATSNDQSYYNSLQLDIRKVYEYYVNRLIKDIHDIGKTKKDGIKFIMWQEVMNNDLQLPNDTIIEVWMGEMADVSRAIGMGYKVIYSTCWYLDRIEYGTKWTKYYQCDPADNTFGYTIDEKMVLGGEACLWSEYVDNENLMTTLWPRASATAERLWSAKDIRDLDTAGSRLQEHRCRMLSRGLSVSQISGPDYCLRRGFGRRGNQKEHNNTCTSGRCVKSRDNNFVEVEDIRLRMTRRGRHNSDCQKTNIGTPSIFILGSLAVMLFALMIGYQKTGGRLPSYKLCKNRTILLLFASVLFIYFMCYTSFWMNMFELSGSFHKTHHSNIAEIEER